MFGYVNIKGKNPYTLNEKKHNYSTTIRPIWGLYKPLEQTVAFA